MSQSIVNTGSIGDEAINVGWNQTKSYMTVKKKKKLDLLAVENC